MRHHYYHFFFFNDTATTEIYTLSLHDALPIYAGSTKMDNLLPAWVHDGGVAKLLERIGDRATRRRIVEECLVDGERWGTAAMGAGGFDEIRIATCGRRDLEGLTLAALARQTGTTPAE